MKKQVLTRYQLRDRAKGGWGLEDSVILDRCDCGNPDPLHEDHTADCMVTVVSIYEAGKRDGFAQGVEDANSRASQRPGFGDMGG